MLSCSFLCCVHSFADGSVLWPISYEEVEFDEIYHFFFLHSSLFTRTVKLLSICFVAKKELMIIGNRWNVYASSYSVHMEYTGNLFLIWRKGNIFIVYDISLLYSPSLLLKGAVIGRDDRIWTCDYPIQSAFVILFIVQIFDNMKISLFKSLTAWKNQLFIYARDGRE